MDEKRRRQAAAEEAAQRARAEALAHLKKNGAKTQQEIVCPAVASASSRIDCMRKMDNTIELMRKRRAEAEAGRVAWQQVKQNQRPPNFNAEIGPDGTGHAPVSFSMGKNIRHKKKRKAGDAFGSQLAAPSDSCYRGSQKAWG